MGFEVNLSPIFPLFESEDLRSKILEEFWLASIIKPLTSKVNLQYSLALLFLEEFSESPEDPSSKELFHHFWLFEEDELWLGGLINEFSNFCKDSNS